jgi:hypothetical protein
MGWATAQKRVADHSTVGAVHTLLLLHVHLEHVAHLHRTAPAVALEADW